ncbi:hypothetical protein PENNAL_c0002G00731 [Penicillium nalgiovense]|uniref:Plastocyanin-like domain-containing protein n=1 Tax=Penicillium nalgiovense TaxID=60175 RepID=A0A1V6Z6Y4_PENNA|nr:hypothetical protein PENNAL_c0002G00731 [Penicillium nalgiovense]
MPSIRHHRRHHTWPQCGSELFMREPRGLEIHVSKLGGGPTAYIPLSFQQAVAAPLSTEELLCDDMGMPEISRQPKRMPRLWFRSSTKGRNDQSSLPGSSGQTKQAYRSVLRRLTRRPPLNKTRSLVVVPSNMRSDDPYIVSGLVAPRNLAKQAGFSDTGRLSDGLYGPLIIHGPATADYDVDLGPIFMTDWYHQSAFILWAQSGMYGGFPVRHNAVAPNGLINSTKNTFPCDDSDDPACLGTGKRSETVIQKGKKYRLRLLDAQADG